MTVTSFAAGCPAGQFASNGRRAWPYCDRKTRGIAVITMLPARRGHVCVREANADRVLVVLEHKAAAGVIPDAGKAITPAGRAA
jgi:hypothetical protein